MIIVDNWQWPQFVMLFILTFNMITRENKLITLIGISINLFILTQGGFFK